MTDVTSPVRTGLLAKKLGMTRIFRDDGTHVPVTVLHIDGLQVVAQRTQEKDGYSAVQVGFTKSTLGSRDARRRAGRTATASAPRQQELCADTGTGDDEHGDVPHHHGGTKHQVAPSR